MTLSKVQSAAKTLEIKGIISKSEPDADQEQNAILLPKSAFERLVISLLDNGILVGSEHPSSLDGYKFAQETDGFIASPIRFETEKDEV